MNMHRYFFEVYISFFSVWHGFCYHVLVCGDELWGLVVNGPWFIPFYFESTYAYMQVYN